MSTDYAIERQLLKLDPTLHKRYKDCFMVSVQTLSRYESTFPNFTDHTVLHSLDVIDFCNQLIGEQLERLTAPDLYVLLMGALFHDAGMGISKKDYKEFLLNIPDSPVVTPTDTMPDVIRRYHQEFSALFLKRCEYLLDIPNPRYTCAIVQVCRGHRKTDLTNANEYPELFFVEEGKCVHLPYIAALLCLADEFDISATRNIGFDHQEIDAMPCAKDRMEFRKHEAVRHVVLERDRVLIVAETEDPLVRKGVEELAVTVQEKLDYCRKVIHNRTDFSLTQKDVVLQMRP